MYKRFGVLSALVVALVLWGCSSRPANTVKTEMTPPVAVNPIQKQLAKFAPTVIEYDKSQLSEGDQVAVLKLVEAAKLMDKIFWQQAYHGELTMDSEMLDRIPGARDYFQINFGPYDRLESNRPFLDGVGNKPPGANYYPADMTQEEFTQWIADHPEDEAAFTSNFTIIRRDGDKLVAIPYSEAYAKYLEPAAKLLLEAAEATDNTSLKTYLTSRAEAFKSNDYMLSDMDWMDLKDHALEVVIGPYEVYEDELLGYKAAFEAFITIVDKEDSEKLEKIGNYLNDLERALPINEQYKNYNRGSSSPLAVVNEVFVGGDAKPGVQTAAFNLPNDERVREAKGSKKVMLKNITEAKYQQVSIPIMSRLLSEADQKKVSFDAFFNHIVLHEMCHGIGPGKIVVDGKETTVSKALKDTYSVLEETKADVVGLYQFPLMIEKGVFDASLQDKLYASFVGGIFRSVRFGVGSAHGGANVITLNYLLEKGGITYDDTNVRFAVNYDKIEGAVRDLARDVLMIQALGDYDGAKAFLAKYRHVAPSLKRALSMLEDIPVDIRPIFAVEEELAM